MDNLKTVQHGLSARPTLLDGLTLWSLMDCVLVTLNIKLGVKVVVVEVVPLKKCLYTYW